MRTRHQFQSATVTPQIATFMMTDDGVFPNNAKLPLTVYRAAVELPDRDPAVAFEAVFASHHWLPAWRSTIFAYHHYHSTAHEVLGVFQGRATIQFGGEHGVRLEVQAGDVVVIPAGVAHKCLDARQGFCAVGAYPRGQQWDMCTGKAGERPQADANIARVPLPQADPVYGSSGPLMTHWL